MKTKINKSFGLLEKISESYCYQEGMNPYEECSTSSSEEDAILPVDAAVGGQFKSSLTALAKDAK